MTASVCTVLGLGCSRMRRAEHQGIAYLALTVLGFDGMKRLSQTLLRPRRAMTYTEMKSGMQR